MKYRKDDGTVKCTNRLLIMIFVSLTLQTIIAIGLGAGLYMAYDNHRDDLNQLGAVPWGAMANDLKSQYMQMDKNAVSDIMKNAKNLTEKANTLVHTHGEDISSDLNTLTTKAVRNVDMVDMVRKMMLDVNKPLSEIVKLIDHKNTVDIKKLRETLLDFVTELDALHINKLILLSEELVEQLKTSLSPETIQDIGEIIDKANKLMNTENSKLVHDLAADADSSVRSINKLFSIFKKTAL